MVKKFSLTAEWIVLLLASAVILAGLLWSIGIYNSLISLQSNIEGQWTQVEAEYQHRADLIPNLVSTIQGFTDQERVIIRDANTLRAQWETARTREEKIRAAERIDQELDGRNGESILGKIISVADNYPQLKNGENFLALQAELFNTVNKVAEERRIYNDAVIQYNTKISTFPSNIIAILFGFKDQASFANGIIPGTTPQDIPP